MCYIPNYAERLFNNKKFNKLLDDFQDKKISRYEFYKQIQEKFYNQFKYRKKRRIK